MRDQDFRSQHRYSRGFGIRFVTPTLPSDLSGQRCSRSAMPASPARQEPRPTVVRLCGRKPPAGARQPDGSLPARFAVFGDEQGGGPRRFGQQEQCVHVGDDADFVALDLVLAAAVVLGVSGAAAVGKFGFRFGAATAGDAIGEFLDVVREIIVHAIKFAAEVGFLALADSGEVGCQVLLQRALQVGAPHVGRGGRPTAAFRAVSGEDEQVEVAREFVVGFAVGQRDRQPMQRPVLFDGLDFASDHGDE